MECFNDEFRDVPINVGATNSTPINPCNVEQFLLRFPEFKPILDDTALAEDFLQSELNAVSLEVSLGAWSSDIIEDSIYLLLAHFLQLRYEQQARSASTAVRSAKGSPFSEMELRDDLYTTSYGIRLQNLRLQSHRFGGFLV